MTRFFHQPGHDKGASAVIVALSLVMLLGFGALSVDVGAMWWNKKQLQNGADAGSLAIAQACAKNLNSPECVPGDNPTAQAFAAANTLGGPASGSVVELQTSAGAVCNGAPGRPLPTPVPSPCVTVETRADRDLSLARVLGFDSATVTASATAGWGAPKKATVLPLAISACWFFYQTGAPTGTPPPTDVVYSIPLVSKSNSSKTPDGPLTCGTQAAHNESSGGFGWLASDPATCGVTIDLASPWVGVSTGRPVKCDLASNLNVGMTVLVPLFDQWKGSGGGALYHVKEFAAFKIVGYCFGSGADSSSPGWPGCKDLVYTAADKGPNLRGTFVSFVSLKDALEFGDPTTPTAGVSVVRLAG